jgi:chemotaxis receptor (MCP) glutamine deamidase CheD
MGRVEVKLAGMGEIVFARGAGVLGCIGLGSCVGALLYEPRTQAAALAHVMLPDANERRRFRRSRANMRPLHCLHCCGRWTRRLRSPRA